MMFANLFKPGKIGKLEIKNRIAMPGMGSQLGAEDGSVSDAVVNWYGRRARGGAGLIIIEVCTTATSIDPYRFFRYAMRLDDPRFIPGFARLTKAIHDAGAKAGIQLTPGGGPHDHGAPWNPGAKEPQYVSPSGLLPYKFFNLATGYKKSESQIRVLATEEVEKMVELCGKAAKYAKEAGFDLIEIHAHYGYLLAEFLSGYYNRRTDKYGGSFENRCRLLLEILASMKKATGPDFPIIVKYSIDEYIEGGRDIKGSQALAKMLVETGVDGITVSAGVSGSRMPTNPPYFMPPGPWVHLAQAVKEAVSVPVVLPGRLHDPQLAEQVLGEGKADFIAIGRGLIADPDWPRKVASGAVSDIRWCLDCNECRQHIVVKNQPVRCSVNAAAGCEGEYDEIPHAQTKKRVVVVGGGPAGMETARVAALRGHQVTLLEQRRNLGGLMALGGVHNVEISRFNSYLVGQVKKLNVEVRMQTEATASIVQQIKPDAVVLAIGGSFPQYDIPGINKNNVFSSKDLLELTNGNPIRKGRLLSLLTTVGRPFITTSFVRGCLKKNFPIKGRVAVIGGQFAGCSLALALAKNGKKVTLIEETDRVGNGLEAHTTIAFYTEVEKGNVQLLTSTRVNEITNEGVVLTDKEGNKSLHPVGTVILAPDLEPSRSSLAAELKGQFKEVYTIGDAKTFGRIIAAISEGFTTAFNL